MPTNTIDGHTFAVNDEGFFTNREEWSEDLAVILAGLVGIEQMTEAHWAPLRFMCSKKGYRTARITRRRDRSYFGFLLGSLVVGLGGIWLSFAFNAPPAITWGGAGLWFLAVLWRAGLEGQRQAVEMEQAARGADAEWNRLLATGTAELPK